MNQTIKRILFFSAPPLITIFLLLGSAYIWDGHAIGAAFFAVPLGIIAMFVIYDGFFLRDDYLRRWTKAHGVDITDENWPVLYRYLGRGRRFRAAGGFLGYATYVIVVSFIARDEMGIGWVGALFGGYLLGAAIAEFLEFRPLPDVPRAAALAPRRLNDYVSRVATTLMRVAPIATVTLVAGWQFIPKGHTFPGEVFPPREFSREPFRNARPDFGEALVWAGIAILLVVIVEMTMRRIVRRPQPAASESLVAADDAIRTTGMHAIVGAGLAMQFGILGHLAGQWSNFTSGGTFHALLGIVGFASIIIAIFAWLRLGIDQPWVVRRTQRRQEAVA
ncbi:MAG: hypothetical protein WAT66_09645 [Actinomycetota bacterium]